MEKATRSSTSPTSLKHTRTQDQEEINLSGSSFEASKKMFLSGTDLKSEVIDSWEQLEKELLNPFYSISQDDFKFSAINTAL
ncbi:hypothetical protein E5676_scaffold546G001650 [Cucumis melo var. makuwa]|uniref:Ty3-gypsy retrotransposon protein n=1 Tax=Cucumis melo var. makuwa TaxID=1194695 RepID=A0A5A7VHE8_CUCMM|nr:hypothetical protein E6C27_scaffold37G00690 [Cucumis melo var. makuwa]TYJ96516.1 hypothetical protein E5676_scaffold546G001650 [Cucumis melo var. makuwa]